MCLFLFKVNEFGESGFKHAESRFIQLHRFRRYSVEVSLVAKIVIQGTGEYFSPDYCEEEFLYFFEGCLLGRFVFDTSVEC